MPLSPIKREANLQDSIKKFFIDSCSPHNIPIQFDKSLAQPNLGDTTTDKWLAITYGKGGYLGNTQIIELLCNVCTRQDPEGCNNIRISDFVRGLLVDDNADNGLARIPIYDFTKPEKPFIGTALPIDIASGVEAQFEDQTKVKQLIIRLWYAV